MCRKLIFLEIQTFFEFRICDRLSLCRLLISSFLFQILHIERDRCCQRAFFSSKSRIFFVHFIKFPLRLLFLPLPCVILFFRTHETLVFFLRDLTVLIFLFELCPLPADSSDPVRL